MDWDSYFMITFDDGISTLHVVFMPCLELYQDDKNSILFKQEIYLDGGEWGNRRLVLPREDGTIGYDVLVEWL